MRIYIIFVLILVSWISLFSQSLSYKILPIRSDSIKISYSPKLMPLHDWQQLNLNNLNFNYPKTDLYKWNTSPSAYITRSPFGMDVRSSSNYVPTIVNNQLNLIMDRDPGTVMVPVFIAAALAMKLADKYILVQKKIEITPQNVLFSKKSIPILQELWKENPQTISQLVEKNILKKNMPLVEVEKLTNVLIDNKIVRRKEILDAEYQLFPAITESKLIELIEIGLVDTTFSPEDLSNLNSMRTQINTR